MHFLIADYRRFYLIFPGTLLLFLLCFDGIHIYSIIRAIVQGNSYAGDIWPIFCTIPVMIIMLILLNRGIRLAFEKSSNMKQITGQIQNIERFFIRPDPINERYNQSLRLHNGKLRLPGSFYVNGCKYICLNVDELVEGRSIMLGYLPKSKCVLYYEYV